MPAQTGQVLNPSGFNGSEPGKRARRKCQNGFDKAIDLLGKDIIDGNGSTRLAELIVEKLESDVVGTLKALSCLFPRQVNVDVQHTTSALQLTDDQLLQIIEARSNQAEKVIDGHIIESEQLESVSIEDESRL